MKITELINEDGLKDYFGAAINATPLANVFGNTVTAGNVAGATGLDAGQVLNYGKKAIDIAGTKLFDLPGGLGAYTVGDALIDVPLVIGDLLTAGAITPAILARVSTKVASSLGTKELEKIAARKGIQTATKDVSQAELAATGRAAADKAAVSGGTKAVARHEIGDTLKKNISFNDPRKSSTGGGGVSPNGQIASRKKKFNVGDMIPVTVKGKSVKAPIVAVTTDGYKVNIGNIPGEEPGAVMDVSGD